MTFYIHEGIKNFNSCNSNTVMELEDLSVEVICGAARCDPARR